MLKLSQKGAIQLIVLLILLAGIVGAVLLVTRGEPLKLLPRATVSGPISPQTSLTLSTSKSNYNVGEEVVMQILVRADIDAANLFTAKLNYDPAILRLGRVDVTSPFIKNWVEQYWADPGKISLIGGVPSPGFQTQQSDAAAVMATLYFTALKTGSTTVSFDDASEIHSNSTNTNILGIKNNTTLTISAVTAPPPTPTPSPTPSASPVACSVWVESVIIGQVSCPSGAGPDWSNIATYTCSDGFRGTVQSAICTTPGDLRQKASSACRQRICPSVCSSTLKTHSPIPLNCSLSGDAGGVSFTCNDGYQGTRLGGCMESFKWYDVAVQSCAAHICTTPTPSPKTCPTPPPCSVQLIIGDPGDPNKCPVYTCPQPSPVATPIPGTGDGNKDGRINLADMSVLLTDFNKASGFRKGIDLNGDGKINTFDFSLMINLLIQKGVIKG